VISFRFVPAICALLILPLVPTWMHSYSGALTSDGLSAAAIPATLGDYRGRPSGRGTNWGKRRFDSEDWIERSYSKGSREVLLTVVRSYDLKTLYHHPELAVAYGPSFQPEALTTVPERPLMPVHVLAPRPGSDTHAMYVLRYEDRFVSNPIWFQIRTAGELLFSPRQPMTMFFTTESGVSPDSSISQLASTAVLLAAVDAFGAQRPAPLAIR
jgi:hypothetical protein